MLKVGQSAEVFEVISNVRYKTENLLGHWSVSPFNVCGYGQFLYPLEKTIHRWGVYLFRDEARPVGRLTIKKVK